MNNHFISRAGCLPYNPKLKERARQLRNNPTKAESKLWFNFLRDLEITFLRQKIINDFIVDFYCSKILLVIEIDGEYHDHIDSIEYDMNRTAILEGYGIKVIRFQNREVYDSFDFVCKSIKNVVEERLVKVHKVRKALN